MSVSREKNSHLTSLTDSCGIYLILQIFIRIKSPYLQRKKKELTLRAGLEPARGDPIGFQVQRLNHSAIAAANS